MSISIIAEFCQNHNGNYRVLSEMIERAAEAGATHGKIQTIYAADLTFRERFEEGLTRDGETLVIRRPYQAEYDRLKRLELAHDEEARFVDDCRRVGLEPLTTCFTRGQVNRLASLGWREVKVASYDCGSLPLLRELAQKFEHLIVSTGATFEDEISSAANLLRVAGARFTFLHCVTIYPTPMDQMHLRRMEHLKKFSNSVGLSNHAHRSHGVTADLAAIWMGASCVERHFSILAPEETRDGPVSIGPEHVREIVAFCALSRDEQGDFLRERVPELEIMLGEANRELSKAELLNRDYYRGRFATHDGDRVIYNWEDEAL